MTGFTKSLAGALSGCAVVLCSISTQAQERAPGVTSSEILIGSCSAQTGTSQKLGQQLLLGASAYIDTVNAKGGVHGRKIRIIKEDDVYDPSKAEPCFKRLLSQNVFADAFFVGTPTAKIHVPLHEQSKVPLVGLFTGAELIYTPLHHYVFNIRASYFDETREQVNGLWAEGLRKIAVIRADDAFGDAVLTGVQRALKAHGAEPVAVASFPRETRDVDAAIATARAANPDAVVMVGSYVPLAEVVRRSHAQHWSPIFLTVSFVGTDEFIAEAGNDAEGTVITEVVPPWNMSAFFRTVDAYRAAMQKTGQRPGYISLEGFIDAMVVVEGLTRAGADLTREKFIKALESIHGDIQGMELGDKLKVNFSASNHKGFQNVFTTVIRTGKAVPIGTFKGAKG